MTEWLKQVCEREHCERAMPVLGVIIILEPVVEKAERGHCVGRFTLLQADEPDEVRDGTRDGTVESYVCLPVDDLRFAQVLERRHARTS